MNMLTESKETIFDMEMRLHFAQHKCPSLHQQYT